VRDAGFTLLEVVLAMTVLGVVMAMLSLSLSGSLRVVEETEQEEEISFQAQTALRRMTDDLASAFLAKGTFFVGEHQEINGQRADALTFVSQAHLVFNPDKQTPGPAVISYRLQPREAQTSHLQLLRSDVPALPGVENHEDTLAASAFLLAENLRSLQLTYFDRQGQEFDSWQQEVTAESQAGDVALPAAVHCILEFWVDPDRQRTQTFSTRVLLPMEPEEQQRAQ
jgi:general secretion pathway protein J